MIRAAVLAWVAASVLSAAGPANVLVVVNERSAISKTVAEYYARRRAIPPANICRIRVTDSEEVDRAAYDSIAKAVGDCIRKGKLAEQILYIVTTMGVPLRVAGAGGMDGDVAAVDSELCLLYSQLKGARHPAKGVVGNPFFGQRDAPFTHERFPIYLVTRLAGYDFSDIRGLIDRASQAKNEGKFVIDMHSGSGDTGENWLRDAAAKLPPERLIFDQGTNVVYGAKDVIGYASWGSNDRARKQRQTGFQWLPGAIMTEFVSTNARTFKRPPDSWTLGTWADSKSWFAGAPQSLIADYLHEGVTGAAGHVAEPYLQFTPRPELLLPAYYAGRNLAESYYLSIPVLSWQNVVVGDPLCALGKP